MNICKICRQDIKRGQSMAVLSFPVKCTKNSGDYSFFGDFSENEQHTHEQCLRKVASELIDILCGDKEPITNTITSEDEVTVEAEPKKVPVDETLSKLHKALKGLSADVTMDELVDFRANHPDESLEELIRLWFQEQDSVV